MARFRYRMQGILDIKLKMETQARQEFAQAQQQLNNELEKKQLLEQQKEMYEARAKELLSGRLDVLEILVNKEAIIHMEEVIAEQEIRVKEANEKLEQVREKLKNVMQERKVHETLKDKAFEEFLMEEKQQESKEIDELTSYLYGQKLLLTEETDAEEVGNGVQTRS